eukprot:6479177-Amphidinium_carterae.1
MVSTVWHYFQCAGNHNMIGNRCRQFWELLERHCLLFLSWELGSKALLDLLRDFSVYSTNNNN